MVQIPHSLDECRTRSLERRCRIRVTRLESHADPDQFEWVSEKHGYRACNTRIPQKSRNSNAGVVLLLTGDSSCSEPPEICLIRASGHQTLQHDKLRELSTCLHGNRSIEPTHMVHLVIGHELDRSIGEDPDQSCRVPLEECPTSAFLVNFRTSAKRSAPSPGIFLEVRIGCLKEDFDSV